MGLFDFWKKLNLGSNSGNKEDLIELENDSDEIVHLSSDEWFNQDINRIYDTDELKKILDKDIQSFGKIDYPSEEIIRYAKENGFDFNSDYLSNHSYYDELFLTLFEYDSSYMKYYNGRSVFVYEKANELGYRFSSEEINSIYDLNVLKRLIDFDVNYFSFVRFPKEETIKYAMEKDFDFNADYLGNNSYNEKLFLTLLDYGTSYIDYYKGPEVDVFIKAVEKGYELSPDDINNISSSGYKKLLDLDVNYFSYMDYYDDETLEYAIEKGFNFTPEYLKKHDYNSTLFSTLLDHNVPCMDYYDGYDVDVMLKARDKGYELSTTQINRASYSEDFDKMIEVNPDYVKYASSALTFEQLDKAIEGGFVVDEEFLEEHLRKELLNNLFRKFPDLCKFYDGVFVEPYLVAAENGYELDGKFFRNNYITNDDVIRAIKLQPYSIRYLLGNGYNISHFFINSLNGYNFDFVDNKLVISKNEFNNDWREFKLLDYYKTAIDSGLEINYELFREYSELCSDPIFMSIAVSYNLDYYSFYKGSTMKVFIEAIRHGYQLSLSEFKRNQYHDIFAIEAVKKFPDYYKEYEGNNPKVLLAAMDSGYNPTDDELYTYRNNDEVMSILIDKNAEYIFSYRGYSVELYKRAMEKLGPESYDRFLNQYFVTQCDELMEIIVKHDPNAIFSYKGYNIEKFVELTSFSRDVPWNILGYYAFNKREFVTHFDEITDFLKKCNINIDEFYQYQFGSNKNWCRMMLNVMENDSLEDFLKVKNYFFKNYYDKKDNAIFNINNFIDILSNYNKYPTFCSNVCDSSSFTPDDKKMIKFLFERNDTDFLKDEIRSLKDLDDVEDKLFDEYSDRIINIRRQIVSFDDIDYDLELEIRNCVYSLLFNNTNIKYLLDKYGNLESLKILQFNNRGNPNITKLIGEMSIYTSIMETISECNDMEKLFNIAVNLLENFDLTMECSTFFQSYEDKMRRLFELECKVNLTRLDRIKDYDSYLDKELTEKYGVDVLDFSDKKYIILGHVKSDSETIEEIVYGKSNGLKNYISLGPISYLKQNFYNVGLTFGYDNMLDGSFITSSIYNMGSNSYLSAYSSKVDDIPNSQKGILETSNPLGYFNSELLAYRAGMRSGCLLVPKDRGISDEVASVAKDYGLKIVITQEENTTIQNPKEIEMIDDEDFVLNDDLDALYELRDNLLSLFDDKNEKTGRKIAVFTDSHGLFEPTLAILEDCRKQGITEIYSLGDNIGTGPNPEEVLDLLDEYNVKSLKGNHEIYVGDGIDSLKEHLIQTGAYQEALNNSEWTRKHISDEHLNKIKLYPSMINLTLGGKNLALVHSTRDYNTGKQIVDVESFHQVLQGHIHFEGNYGNVYTLRGAGIGLEDESEGNNKAFYIVLTENDGGYSIERKFVSFNRSNMRSDIISSDLNDHDKDKISAWVSR